MAIVTFKSGNTVETAGDNPADVARALSFMVSRGTITAAEYEEYLAKEVDLRKSSAALGPPGPQPFVGPEPFVGPLPPPSGGGGGQISGGGGSQRTAQDILVAYRTGGMGREEAERLLIQMLVSGGLSAAESAREAAESLDGVQIKTDQLQPDERRGAAVSPFGESLSGQRTAFGAFRGERFPEGLPFTPGRALEGQFEAITPFFDHFRDLNIIDRNAPFSDFLTNNLGRGGFDPRSAAQQISNVFGVPIDQRSEGQSTVARNLTERPNQQRDLAFAVARQGFPLSSLGTLSRVLGERFGRFQTDQTDIDQTTGLPGVNAPSFLEAFLQGKIFGSGR